MSTQSFSGASTLRTRLDNTSWPAGADQEVLQATLKEAFELGRGAYADANPSDVATAERLLYVIHRDSAFGPPVPAVPALIWAALVQAKLNILLPPMPDQELDEEEMVAALEEGVREDGTHAHPLLDDLAAEGDLRGYRVFLKNWYAMASGFTEFLISVAQRATPAMLGGIVENLSEELLDEIPHIDLRTQVLEGAETAFDAANAPEDEDIVTETFSLINWRAAASALSDPCLALGLFYSIEANWHFECGRHLAALRAAKVPEDHLTSLAIHVEADEDHAEEWLTMIREAVVRPRDRATVVRGLSVEFDLRRQMYDAIGRNIYGP